MPEEKVKSVTSWDEVEAATSVTSWDEVEEVSKKKSSDTTTPVLQPDSSNGGQVGASDTQFTEDEYDYESAKKYGVTPDETGHYPSRVPSGEQEGLILKSENHPTFNKTLEGEKAAGYEIYRNLKDNRLYSFKKGEKPKFSDWAVYSAPKQQFTEGAKSGLFAPATSVPKEIAEQPAQYKIDGVAVTPEEMTQKLFQKDVIESLQQGKINFEFPTEDVEMESLVTKQAQSGGQVGDVWENIKAGTARLGAGVVGAKSYVNNLIRLIPAFKDVPKGMDEIASEEAADKLIEYAKEEESKVRQYEEGFINEVQQGNIGNATSIMFNTLGQSTPAMASIILTSGAGTLPAIAATGTAFSSSEFADDETKKLDGKELTPQEKALRATGYGFAESVFGQLPTSKILSKSFPIIKQGIRGFVSKAFQSGGKEAAESVAKEAAKQSAAMMAKGIGIDATKEIGGEVITEWTQMGIDDYLGVADYTVEDYKERGAEAAALSLAMTGFIQSPQYFKLGKKLADENIKKTGGKNIVDKAKAKQESGEITPQQLDVITLEVEKRNEAINAVPDEYVGETEVVDLVQQKQELDEKAKNVDPVFKEEINEQKKAIDEQLKTKVEEIKTAQPVVPKKGETVEIKVGDGFVKGTVKKVYGENKEAFDVEVIRDDGAIVLYPAMSIKDLKGYQELITELDKPLTDEIKETETPEAEVLTEEKGGEETVTAISEEIIEEPKAQEDAISQQITGQVPVQSETTISEGVEKGTPETGLEETAQQSERKEEIAEGVKKTILTKRAYEGKIRDEVKTFLEEKGLTRIVISQKERSQGAEDLINQYGEEAALEAVKQGDIRGALAASTVAKLIKRVDDKMAELSPTDVSQLDELAKQQSQLIDLLGQEAFFGGEYNSQLAFEYESSDIGYNLAKKISDYKKEFGDISPEVEAKFRETDKKLKEAIAKIAELEKKDVEAQNAINEIKESVERQKKKTYKERAKKVADEFRKLKTKPFTFTDAEGNVIEVNELGFNINELIELGAKAIEKAGEGADYIAVGMSAIRAKLAESDFYNALSAKNKELFIKQIEEQFAKQQGETTGKIKVPHALIRDFVERGIDNIADLTAAVKDSLKEKYPDATDREIRDAITEYGKISNPNQEQVEKDIRKMKLLGRLMSQLEDIQAKKRPLRSGAQRDKLDAEERAKMKEVREAMKELAVDEETAAEQLKTATDAAKQRLRNQIEDLEREIERGEKVPRSTRTVKEDAELKELKEKRDKLKEESDKIFKDEEFKEKKRLENAKKAAQRRIEDLERKLKDKDFSKKKTTPVIEDSELIALRAEKLRLQEEYDKEFYKAKLLARTDAEKRIDKLWDLWGLTRGLSATGEASFVGIQGLVQTLAHPKNAAQAFKNAIKFFGSTKKTEDWLRNIKSQEWYPTLKNSKLALTEPHAEITAREELFYSGYTDLIWNTLGIPFKKISPQAYENWKSANPLKAIERASVGYLDTLRVLRFLDGMEILKEQGKTFENSPQDYKDVADAINTLTGRASLGKLNQFAEPLSKIFFSPRNWASQIKTATPYALYHFGKMTPTARKMAIADFSKYVGLTTAMVMTTAAFLNNDDDEETSVEYDPRSSDFMKIKLGDKRIDPWGGRIQQVVLTSRLMLDMLHDVSPELSEGGMKTKKGEIVPLGTPYKAATKKETLIRQAMNKLAPSARLLERYLSAKTTKDGTKTDEFGQPYEFSEDLKESLRPIFWSTVSDLLKDDPTALDGLLITLAFFGYGVNVQEDKDKKSETTTSQGVERGAVERNKVDRSKVERTPITVKK
jgi:hypothetical protein